jgi:hypothetical protein
MIAVDTSEARTFWQNFRGPMQTLARFDWKGEGSTGLYPVEAAQDAAGNYYGKIRITGRPMVTFGPHITVRDLKKDIISWSRNQGLTWHFKSPGTFLPDLLQGELHLLGITGSHLAGMIGVNDHRVRQWLQGVAEPTEDELQSLCEAIGVFPADIERR